MSPRKSVKLTEADARRYNILIGKISLGIKITDDEKKEFNRLRALHLVTRF